MNSNRSLRKTFRGILLLVFAATFGHGPDAFAEVRLPNVFGAHMVLQQDKPLVIWGWDAPDQTVTVRLASSTRQVRANDRGEWKAVLPAMKAGGPFTLEVQGSTTVRLEDVLLGEVWLCSGQSNMEMGIQRIRNGQQEINAANQPKIRLLLVPRKWSPEPQEDVDASWKVCSPKSVAEGEAGGFSAVAYFFGLELHKRLDVPVGLIEASWGGTRIEPWTPPEGFASVPALRSQHDLVKLGNPGTSEHQARLEQLLKETEQWLTEAREAQARKVSTPPMPVFPAELKPPHDVQHATALYNGMIHPLCPFPIRGAIWYQGESNLDDGMAYTEKMKALIGGWRELWGLGDFPFYFVQIAPFNYQGKAARVEAEFWEAQTAAQAIPNTGMAVINDLADLKDIHPNDKKEVGQRLAFWALAKTYDQSGVVHSGPTFQAMRIEPGKLRVGFDHAAGGLASRDGKPLTWFEIIDAEEGGFVKADAQIEGSSVVLSSPEVKHPVAMRFAWSMLAEPNLVNGAGLPAGAFRSGSIPNRDALKKISEAADYQLLYDLDLTRIGRNITYATDNRSTIRGPIERIAYCLELHETDGNVKYVYVSMDAFTQSLDKIGVPTFTSGIHFQQKISGMNVFSNVKGITAGTGLAGGNIEFWPNNYGTVNSAEIPNASATTYDFGDQPSDPADGYGSMQIHNHETRQTLFAINHWREGAGADFGIGNQPTGNPDWTFAKNAGAYPKARLRILVQTK